MNLSSAKRSGPEPNGRIPFQFSPTPPAIPPSEVFQSVDTAPGGDDLDISDVADDFKHRIDRRGCLSRRFGRRRSTTMALVHPRGDIAMVEQPAFPARPSTLLNLAPEPFIAVHRSGQQVQGDLVRASCLCREARQLGCEFGRNLQVHETSLGCIDSAVNRRLPWSAVAELSGSRLQPAASRRRRRTAFAWRDSLVLAKPAVARANGGRREDCWPASRSSR
jgi:hypothetical protein